jgi:hypothetical protein
MIDGSIDWFRVIADLNGSGYTYPSIAASVGGVSKNTIRNWRDGSAPRFDEGERLIALWAQVTAKSQETVPRIKLKSTPH